MLYADVTVGFEFILVTRFPANSFVPDLAQISNLDGVCINVTKPNGFFFSNENRLNKQSQKSPTSSRILRKVQIYLNFAHLSPFPEAQSFISTEYATHNLLFAKRTS